MRVGRHSPRKNNGGVDPPTLCGDGGVDLDSLLGEESKTTRCIVGVTKGKGIECGQLCLDWDEILLRRKHRKYCLHVGRPPKILASNPLEKNCPVVIFLRNSAQHYEYDWVYSSTPCIFPATPPMDCGRVGIAMDGGCPFKSGLQAVLRRLFLLGSSDHLGNRAAQRNPELGVSQGVAGVCGCAMWWPRQKVRDGPPQSN